jgi:ribonuclease P protein component
MPLSLLITHYLQTLMQKTFSYNKKEKLKSRTLLNEVFASSKPVLVFPVKVFYKEIEGQLDNPVKLGVGVSGRNFKKSVDRNRVKRLLREAYRLNKEPLYKFAEENQKNVAVFLLYIDKALPTFELLQKKMPQVLHKLIKVLSENNTPNT